MTIAKLLKAVSYAGVKRQPGADCKGFPRPLIDALLANGAAELVCDGACPFPSLESVESGDDIAVEVEVEEPERRPRRSRKVESEED